MGITTSMNSSAMATMRLVDSRQRRECYFRKMPADARDFGQTRPLSQATIQGRILPMRCGAETS
jgi:hypothetical protein